MVRLAKPSAVDHRRVPGAHLTPTSVQLSKSIDEFVRSTRERDQVQCSLLGDTRVGMKSGKSVFGVLATEQSLDSFLRDEPRSRFEFDVLRVLSEHLMLLLRDATHGCHPLECPTEYIALCGDREPFDERGDVRLRDHVEVEYRERPRSP